MIHDDITPREHTGPIHLVEETEDQRRISALERAYASVQKKGWALLIAVITSLGGFAVYLQNRAHAAGALEQKIIDLENTIKDVKDTSIKDLKDDIKSLGKDVNDIRRELIRRSAIDPPRHAPTSDLFRPDILTQLQGPLK